MIVKPIFVYNKIFIVKTHIMAARSAEELSPSTKSKEGIILHAQCAAPVCMNVSSKTCTGCYTTRYCSTVCQSLHRDTHREFCESRRKDREKYLNSDKDKSMISYVGLSKDDYILMLETLKTGKPFNVVDKEGGSELALLDDKELPYEKSTSRRIVCFDDMMSKVDKEGGTRVLESFYAKLTLAYGSPIWQENSMQVFSIRIKLSKDDDDGSKRHLLLFDGKTEEAEIIPYTIFLGAIIFQVDGEPVSIRKQAFDEVSCKKPFEYDGKYFY